MSQTKTVFLDCGHAARLSAFANIQIGGVMLCPKKCRGRQQSRVVDIRKDRK